LFKTGLCALVVALVYWSQPLDADCAGWTLSFQLKNPHVDVILSGSITQLQDIRRDPVVQQTTRLVNGTPTRFREERRYPLAQHVTLLVERVWKGPDRQTFEFYNLPGSWEPVIARSETSDGRGTVSVSSGVGGGLTPFDLGQSYVVVARRLTSRERNELGIVDSQERFGTSHCRDESKSVQSAEKELKFIGPGRKPQ
jgi:hypothetical protein